MHNIDLVRVILGVRGTVRVFPATRCRQTKVIVEAAVLWVLLYMLHHLTVLLEALGLQRKGAIAAHKVARWTCGGGGGGGLT